MNKLVVITTPYFFADEASLIELLFAEGMSRLHLRKPDCKRDELEGLLDKISPAYYDRIVLHDWFTLAEERALGGIHLNKRLSSINRYATMCSLARSFRVYPKKDMVADSP